MKRIIFYSLMLLFSVAVYSQSLIMKGKIKCQNPAVSSTKGAENIVVVPAFMPSKATTTVTRPSGYFEFNTGVPISKLQDKTVTIYVISRCNSCKEIAKRIFISEDQDRQNREDQKKYVTIKEWMLNTNCQKAELVPLAADSVLSVVTKQPGQDLDKMTAASALTGTPAFLNFLTNLIPVVGVLPNAGTFQLYSLFPGKIKYGQFLSASPFYQSANTGFNFSPSRDISEAAFWNPSAIAFSRKPYNISLLTNLKNNVKLSGFLKPTEKLSIALGGIYAVQDERRKSTFVRTPLPADSIDYEFLAVDTTVMKLKEYAAFISPVYKVNDMLSVGLTLKSVWQDFNIPNQLLIEFTNGVDAIGTFTDSSVKKQKFDVDISATLKIGSSLQAGINLMNLAGTKLYGDAFVSGQANIPMRQQRSFGLGLTYKWQRLNIGADLLFTDDDLYDVAFGANYVPFNNALISAGIAVKQVSYSFAFRLKYFRIAYINDNNWLINEKKTGKSSILNGKLYGGIILDLN